MTEVQPSTNTSAASKSSFEATVEMEKPLNSTSSPSNRIFAPLNIPWYRRCQTLTILVWWLLPWSCLILTIVLLRSDRWYISGGTILYITWMIAFRKHPKEGGHRQQWLRRLFWWKWYAGSYEMFVFFFFGFYSHCIFRLFSNSFT